MGSMKLHTILHSTKDDCLTDQLTGRMFFIIFCVKVQMNN